MSTGDATGPASSRLSGIDAARGLALIGMMTVHVLPAPPDAGGDQPITQCVYRLAEGRSAALFAVLAGVSLVLSKATRTQITVRAILVGAVGMTLGSVPGPIAVILACYGLFFLLALPFLRLPVPVLAALAALWAVLSPVASQWLRIHGLAAYPQVPQWSDLTHPADLLRTLLLTGYYPALTWLTYLLAGLAIGRLLLGRDTASAARTGRWIALTGAIVVALSWTVSALAVRAAGGVRGLTGQLDADSLVTGRGPRLLQDSFYGTTQLNGYRWVLVDAPHSGSITDLTQTVGSALLVLGVALVAAAWAAGHAWALRAQALVAAGAMTLSIYTVHVLVVDVVHTLPDVDRPPPWLFLLAQVALALGIAAAYGAPATRGPLEEAVARAVRAVPQPPARQGSAGPG